MRAGEREVAMNRRGFETVVAMWRRRKWLATVVFLIPFAASVGVARALPDVYQSTASVLVEHQTMQERLVGSGTGSELETRLRTINQRIMSRSRLHDLILEFDLYPDLQARASVDDVVDRMRRDIAVESQIIRDPIGRDWTIALSISFRGRDPETVARVANALAAFYVEENARIRTQQSAGTTEFLRVQVEEARRQLEEHERQLSQLKGHLPDTRADQQTSNPATLQRLNAQLREIHDQQQRAMERRDALAMRLAEITGGSQSTAIAVSSAIQARQLRDGIAEAEAELAALRDKERALRETIAASGPRTAPISRTERELQITRDYEAAKQLYQSLLQRYEEAQLAERMAQDLQGRQLRILDAAVAADEPVAPRRKMIALVGLMIALGLAAGVATLAESLDSSFHTVDDLRAFTSIPVLVSIPRIITRADTRRRRVRFVLGAVAAGAGAAAVVAGSSYLAGAEILGRLPPFGSF